MRMLSANCGRPKQRTSGRRGGLTTRRSASGHRQAQRPREVCGEGEVSLLAVLLLRIDSFMFSLSSENQYFSYFLSYFFRFFVLFVIVFEASFRVWASVIISLRVVAPSDSHFSPRTQQDLAHRVSLRNVFEILINSSP